MKGMAVSFTAHISGTLILSMDREDPPPQATAPTSHVLVSRAPWAGVTPHLSLATAQELHCLLPGPVQLLAPPEPCCPQELRVRGPKPRSWQESDVPKPSLKCLCLGASLRFLDLTHTVFTPPCPPPDFAWTWSQRLHEKNISPPHRSSLPSPLPYCWIPQWVLPPGGVPPSPILLAWHLSIFLGCFSSCLRRFAFPSMFVESLWNAALKLGCPGLLSCTFLVTTSLGHWYNCEIHFLFVPFRVSFLCFSHHPLTPGSICSSLMSISVTRSSSLTQ